MPLSDQQIKELDIAQSRVSAGTPGTEDVKNLEYAAKTYGYNYTPYVAPAQTPTTPPPTTTAAPTVPVKIEPKSPMPETTFDQAATTTSEISSQLLANQAKLEQSNQEFLDEVKVLNKQMLDASSPTEEEIELVADIKDLTNQSRDLQLRAQAGADEQGQRHAPMPLIIGAQEKIFQQANRTLQTLSAQQAPLIDRLNAVQAAREAKLNQLQLTRQFLSENQAFVNSNSKQKQELLTTLFNLEQQAQQIKKQEMKEAKQFALDYNVTSPMYQVAGVVYDTATGEAKYKVIGKGFHTIDGETTFNTPEQFFKHSGLTSFNQITQVKAPDELDELLTLAEAKSYGVPYGTTYRQMQGKVPITVTGGDGSDTSKVTTAVRNALLGGGFTEDQIPIVDETVKEEGIDFVLGDSGLSEQQKNAIRKAYGVAEPPTLDEILNSLGFSAEEKREYKAATQNSNLSIDPIIWLTNYRA